MIGSKVSIRLRKSITYNIVYLFTSLMGGCWCSNKNVTNTANKDKNNFVQDSKNRISGKNDNDGINRADHGGADNDRENNNNKNSNNNTQNQFQSILSNPGQYKPTEVSTKCSNATSSLQTDSKASLIHDIPNINIDSTQKKVFQENNQNNDTLSKESLGNNDNDKESSEQTKEDLPNNTSNSNDIESLNNSNEETINNSKNSTTNLNTDDTTSLEEAARENTSFLKQPQTNLNYKPNDNEEPRSNLTTISNDQQNANPIPITNSRDIIFSNDSDNSSNNSTANSNTGDATFLKGTREENTSFLKKPPTNRNYQPNHKEEPANTLTINSTDQKNDNSIPITNSLEITVAKNSEDQRNPTNQETSEKTSSHPKPPLEILKETEYKLQYSLKTIDELRDILKILRTERTDLYRVLNTRKNNKPNTEPVDAEHTRLLDQYRDKNDEQIDSLIKDKNSKITIAEKEFQKKTMKKKNELTKLDKEIEKLEFEKSNYEEAKAAKITKEYLPNDVDAKKTYILNKFEGDSWEDLHSNVVKIDSKIQEKDEKRKEINRKLEGN